MSGDVFESFRDPAGSVVISGGHVYRFLQKAQAEEADFILGDRVLTDLVRTGRVVGTRTLSEVERTALAADPNLSSIWARLDPAVILEHERVQFPSYPYEWCPEMLHAAASLTLDICNQLNKSGFGLKDATPYNVLFRASDPVFVDVLSFERRHPQDPVWLANAQFLRTFVLPLLANKYYGLTLADIFLSRRDGLEPEEAYRWTKPLQRIRPPFLSTITLPTLLNRSTGPDASHLYHPRRTDTRDKATFILGTQFSRLARTIRRLTPTPNLPSRWSRYTEQDNNYSQTQAEAKRQFVAAALDEVRPRCVLDIGCNTGQFSRMAARTAKEVVAIDYDPVVVGRVWRISQSEGLPILPLAVNLSRPTPATGWATAEYPSFLDRARGRFDTVLMLAVVHHLLVTDRIPLHMIVEMAALLTRDSVIVEFVGPQDSMFRRITRGRDCLHTGYSQPSFEAEFARRFQMCRKCDLPDSSRSLYLLRKL